MATLKSVLGTIRKELKQKDDLREETHYDMRKATSLSKQAILLIHQKKMKEPRNNSQRQRKYSQNCGTARPSIRRSFTQACSA